MSLDREVADWLRAALPAGAALVADSRQVRPGDAFFAYPGTHADGRAFVADALARGAAAVVVEPGTPRGAAAVAWREVPDLKALAGPIAAAFYHQPSAHLDVVAVTGTNGKTSCTHWVAQGWELLGRPAAVMGTLGLGRPGQLAQATLTTPDALSAQRCFAEWQAAGVQVVALEASSIGLQQQRLAGARVRVAVFTNLTRDHLDYHGTMSQYQQAKAALFAWPHLDAAVVNLDDPAHGAMLAAAAPNVRRIGYGLEPSATPVATRLWAHDVQTTPQGTRFELAIDDRRGPIATPLLGRFNVANLLAVAGTWWAQGMDEAQIRALLPQLQPVPGRLQTVGGAAAQPLVVVDYAHTPDALVQVLGALRPVAQARGGQLWCVLGAGGDRDPGKRPAMAAAAEAGADSVVLTSDNPRSEAPQAIGAAMAGGLQRPPAHTEFDRARAIAWAIDQAAAPDVVLIAGKGHETYQEIAGVRHLFSDVGQAAQALADRADRHPGPHQAHDAGSSIDAA